MTEQPTPGTGQAGDPGRDPRLAAFAHGGPGDTCPPGPGLVRMLAELSGPQQCPGATEDEVQGMLRRWAAVESWAAAEKLGLVRELIRRSAEPGAGRVMPGGLPYQWREDLAHELSALLRISPQAADKLLGLAWDLEARIPGIEAKLAEGKISMATVTLVVKEFSVLDDAQAAVAEKLIRDDLENLTPGQAAKLAARAVCTVDPDGVRKRREAAERDDARVAFWREPAGTAAIAGFALPTDAALAADASVQDRAAAYKKAKIIPSARMDQLRALAYLDLLREISLDRRLRLAAEAQEQEAPTGEANNDDGRPGDAGDAGPGGDGSGGDDGDSGAEDNCEDDGESLGSAVDYGDPRRGFPARCNLTIPLLRLPGVSLPGVSGQRPGESQGLGALDPALAGDLAAAAAASSRSEFCVTVTSPVGYAIGHGCCRTKRTKKGEQRGVGGGRDGPAGTWAFTRDDSPGPPGGYGSWTLTLPDGRELTVDLKPVPVTDCDHRYESHSYQPSDTLRHLVQIRDAECTFPTCSRHARESDFEHAVPYHKGGKTDACNAGARSRRCHRVKQSPGWTVTQPRPGWHRWETPSGRVYFQGPKRHPA
jgi:hypothetical protein